MQDVQDEEVCVSTLLYREQLSLILAILAILAILFRFLHLRWDQAIPTYNARRPRDFNSVGAVSNRAAEKARLQRAPTA